MARGEERGDSDIDFLVELEPDARPIEILSIGVELEEALGVKVDVGTPASLRERVRDEVLAEAVLLCAGGMRTGSGTSSTTTSGRSPTRCRS